MVTEIKKKIELGNKNIFFGIQQKFNYNFNQPGTGIFPLIPDYWLKNGNPWEIERPDIIYPIRFYGHVSKYWDNGVERATWEGG